jgi:hypothetical protein
LCLSISSIVIPLNIDFFNKSYYWLFGYAPLLLLAVVHFPFLAFDSFKSNFYPFPRLECAGLTSRRTSVDVIIYFFSLFNSFPLLIFISGLILFIPGLKEFRLSIVFLTPVFIVSLWDLFTFIIVGIKTLSAFDELEKKELKIPLIVGFIITAMVVISMFFFYFISIVLISLKLDQRIQWMYWSIIFVFVGIWLFLLCVTIVLSSICLVFHLYLLACENPEMKIGSYIVNIYLLLFCNGCDRDYGFDVFSDELWKIVVIGMSFLLVTIYHLFVSAAGTLLVFGLMLDNVFKTLYIYVTAVSFFGGLLFFTTLTILLVVTLFCCLCCCFCVCWLPFMCCSSFIEEDCEGSLISDICTYPQYLVNQICCDDD